MIRIRNLIFGLGWLIVVPTITHACMCGNVDAAGAFITADVVFIGKVVKIAHVRQASVGLLVKEAGTLELLKDPRWEKSTYPARVVTFEVTESFKGTLGKTFQLVTLRYDDGATCGVNFKTGESFLVYAHKRRRELSADQIQLPKEQWTNEISPRLTRTNTINGSQTLKQRSAQGPNVCAGRKTTLT